MIGSMLIINGNRISKMPNTEWMTSLTYMLKGQKVIMI